MQHIQIDSFQQKKDWLKRFQPESETWVVSDLQSKWEIQGKLLNQERVLEETTVLRANEFWTKLLFRVNTQWTMVSREMFDQWIWHWLKANPVPWLKVNESANLIHQHLEFFAPILVRPESVSLLEEWFEQHPESVIRWRHLFEICERLWSEMSHAKILSPALVPAVLLNELEDRKFLKNLWDKKVHLDLGLRPRAIERHLATVLSEQMEMVWFENQIQPEGVQLNGVHKRLPTQLGEVKQAVAQVRKWLEEGMKAEDIVILAPDIEVFWPSLHYLFEIEGVPLNKSIVQSLIDDPYLQKWISTLRIQINEFSHRDLESHFFQSESAVKLKYDEFRYYFETLKNPEDAHRWKNWRAVDLDVKQSLTLTDFFQWAIRSWDKSFKADPLDRVWKVLSKDFDPRLKMEIKDWIFYLETKLSKSETNITEAALHGVKFLSLSSAEWCEAEHAIFLGNTDSELSVLSNLSISRFECDLLNQDLGFTLDVPQHSIQELYLGWVSQKDFSNMHFYTSGTTFSGDEVSPSKYWLRSVYSLKPEMVKRIESPQKIRFDEVAQTFETTEDQFEAVPFSEVSLSATSVKSFKECPFRFFAQKGLRLVDQPVLDFDLDPLNKGRLLHAVFEVVIEELEKYASSKDLIEKLIDQLKEELEITVGELKIWPAMKKELTQLTQNFIHMELELRRIKPNLKTLDSEVGFEFYFNLDSLSLSLNPESQKSVRVTGRIDRVDGHGDKVAVIDYKLSSARLRTWSSWAEEGDLQMPIYSLALENGFSEVKLSPKAEVEAGYYLIPRTKERHKGYFLKDTGAQVFIEPSSRSRSWITLEKKQELLEKSKLTLKEVGELILEGRLAPNPKDFEICEICRWRNLCRAQHLI